MDDILARIFAQKFSDKTRQPVVVENRTGAGGVIAAEYVARSPADGTRFISASTRRTRFCRPSIPSCPTMPQGLAPVIHIANLPNVLG